MSHLALGLSKRLSASNASPPKRQSVNLSFGGRGKKTSNSNPSSALPTLAPNTPSELDLTSEDGNVTSHADSPSAASFRVVLKDQETEIDRLTAVITDLRDELDTRPTEEELEDMRKEWVTSEDLFAQSQKDNEQKHATIEYLRQYIKGLEHKLEEMLGDGWRDCCPNLPPPPTSGNGFASTTPLPRPGSNVNVNRTSSSKRASRSSRGGGSFEAARLRELRDIGSACEKTTPTSALRKLEGINEGAKNPLAMSTRSSSSQADCFEVDGLIDTTIISTGSGSGATPPTASPVLPTHPLPATVLSSAKVGPSAQKTALADQVAQLTNLVKALPGNIATQIVNDDDRAAERARVEEQKLAMLEMLEAAEQRADAREMRLQGMLAEAKACSGQMGW